MDFLISIPGPQFLLLYVIFGVILILAVRLLLRRDHTMHLNLPQPNELTPAEIGFLKSGAFNYITTIMSMLWDKKHIEIDSANAVVKSVSHQDKAVKLSAEEKLMLDYIGKERKTSEMVTSVLVKHFNDHFEALKNKLRNKYLLADEELIQRNKKIYWFGFIVLFGVGALKLYTGITYDKPYGFLLVLLIIFLYAYHKILNIKKFKLTALGRKFIAYAEIRFRSAKQTEAEQDMGMGDSYYSYALFGAVGASALAMPSLYPEEKRNWSSDTSGGCTTGYDSDSSDSGSGCSGSDGGSDGGSGCSGGSGCGGCGGGGD